MKSISIIFIFLCLLTSCTTEKIENTDVYLFMDTSSQLNRDQELLTSSIPAILNKIGVSDMKGGLSGGQVKLFLLGEVSRSPYKTISIESGEGGLMDERSNRYIRSDEVKSFKAEIVTAIETAIETEDWGRSNTKIYQQLCREFRSLKASNADHKVVVIFSDMLENSDLFSFYNEEGKPGLRQVKGWLKDQAALTKAVGNLSADCAFPNLDDIEIHIVSNRSKKTDELINVAEQFWTRMFTMKGARKVSHGAELVF